MNKLQAILAKYARVELVPLGPEAPPLEKSQLQADLKGIVSGNDGLLAVCLVMIVGLFILQLWIAMSYISQLQVIASIIAAFGVSAAILIRRMMSLWRARVATRVLLALIPILSESNLQTVVNEFVKGVKI